MKCPYCGSDNYHFVEVEYFDEDTAELKFKCLGKCGNVFYGEYDFVKFTNDNGEEIMDSQKLW